MPEDVHALDELTDVRESLHDRWCHYEDRVLGRLDTPGRDKFFGATDALWDVDDALRSARRGLPSDSGLAKLAAYGLLQALVVQQDAARILGELVVPQLGWLPYKVRELAEIRTLRHRLSGHFAFAERTGGTASIIDVRDRMSIAGHVYGLPENANSGERYPRAAIEDLILANAHHLLPILREVDRELAAPEVLFDRLRLNLV